MKTPQGLLLACAMLATSSVSLAQENGLAHYRVTFDVTWSNATHPGAYPGGAHLSPPIGATHLEGFHIWQPGGTSTPGMEQMAETGGTSVLTAEINALIAASSARTRLTASGFNAPGERGLNVRVTPEYPAVTLVTMVAPSPDWFIGCDSVNLLQNGEWVDTLEVPLVVWDAGTDGGANFNSGNQNTNPKAPIALVTGGPFTGTDPMGTLRFERQRSTLVYGSGINPVGSLQVQGEPRLGQQVTMTLSDPFDVIPSGSATILAFSTSRIPTFPAGTLLPGAGLASPGSAGELLVGAPFRRVAGPMHTTGPVNHVFTVPTNPAFVGASLYAQGAFIAPNGAFGLTDAVELFIGN